jgi:hypothetical protein
MYFSGLKARHFVSNAVEAPVTWVNTRIESERKVASILLAEK